MPPGFWTGKGSEFTLERRRRFGFPFQASASWTGRGRGWQVGDIAVGAVSGPNDMAWQGVDLMEWAAGDQMKWE